MTTVGDLIKRYYLGLDIQALSLSLLVIGMYLSLEHLDLGSSSSQELRPTLCGAVEGGWHSQNL